MGDTNDMDKKPLNEIRIIYIDDLGAEIPEVTVEFFQSTVLPQVDPKVFEDVFKAVEASDLVSGNRWKVFPDDPKDIAAIENTAFSPLEDLWQGIVNIAKNVNKGTPVCQFQPNPTQTLESEKTLGSSYKVDGAVMLLKSKGAGTGQGWKIKKKPPTATASSTSAPPAAPTTSAEIKEALVSEPLSREAADAACTFEVKKYKTPQDRNDNVAKSVEAVSHLLHNDPCRRFTFSVTIENTTTRLWFYSRAIAMVCEDFNFILDRRTWVYFVLSLAFASEAELGYDPTIERVVEYINGQPRICYDILVGDKWYRSINWLDNYRASRIISRATRVWQVRLRDDPPNTTKVFALKDVWISADALSEQEILEDIFSRVGKVNPIDDLDPDYKEKYFMTILADECVTVNGQPDTTSTLYRSHPLLPDGVSWFALCLPIEATHLPAALPGTVDAAGRPGAICPLPRATSRREDAAERAIPPYEHKQHRRILFAEVGRTLDGYPNHQQLFNALAHVTKGLKHLYSAGYVHRDISASNLLLCGDVCKLADFEYAKRYDNAIGEGEVPKGEHLEAHTFKTGTPAFMAIEIQTGEQEFLPSRTRTLETMKSVGKAAKAAVSTRNPRALDVVRHNYLHDIESIWWVSMWTLFTSLPGPPAIVCGKRILDQEKESHKLFPHTLDGNASRRRFFLDYHDILSVTLETVLPDQYSAATSPLMGAWLDLTETYKAFEANPESFLRTPGFVPTYDAIHTWLLETATVAETHTVRLPNWKVPDRPIIIAANIGVNRGTKRSGMYLEEELTRSAKQRKGEDGKRK